MFWVVVLSYLWYCWLIARENKYDRMIQSINNIRMETIHDPERQDGPSYRTS